MHVPRYFLTSHRISRVIRKHGVTVDADFRRRCGNNTCEYITRERCAGVQISRYLAGRWWLKTCITMKYIPSLGKEERRTTFAQREGSGTDSNPRHVDEANQTLRLVSMSHCYIIHVFHLNYIRNTIYVGDEWLSLLGIRRGLSLPIVGSAIIVNSWPIRTNWDVCGVGTNSAIRV